MVPSQRDNFSSSIKEVLAKRAGQRCSNPECRAITSGPHNDDQKAINLGVAAHMTAAAPGGPRCNLKLSAEERADISNGIWLCRYCATLVDSDTTRFSEAVLTMWKRRHEEWIKAQMGGMQSAASARVPGLLNVSEVYQRSPADNLSCILDFRVSNPGDSDLMINAVEFHVLESLFKMPLGQASYSAQYDLDISGLKEYGSSAACELAQILKPGEADRFAIVVSAPSLKLFAGWRLATRFKTNFGVISGPEIEIWLPRPEVMRSFAELTQLIPEKYREQVRTYGAGTAKSRPIDSAGYETHVIVGMAIMWYYGPLPLIAHDECTTKNPPRDIDQNT